MTGGGLLVRWIFLNRRRVVLRPTAYTTPPIDSDAINPQMRRVIVSDVHLGAGDRLDDFDDDDQLIAFIDHYVAGPAPTELILAGDTLEFLQVRLPFVDDDEYSDRAAELRVLAIIKAHAGVFAALARFLATPANCLTFLIGNHDFELHYPAAKHAIRRTLGLDSDNARLRFGVSYRGGGIYLVHGNQFDSWNRFLNFDGISEPFEVPRGTQMVKEVVNALEDDPLPQAPLLDNVKPTSAFLWYMLALPRLRDRAARRFTLRGIAGYIQVAAWPTPHQMPITGDGPGGMLSVPALAWFWQAIAVFRRGRVARQQQVSRSVGQVAEIVDPPNEVIDRVQIEATRRFEREARAFRDRYAREMLNLARSPEHRHLTLFVCGHTHRAAVVPLGLGQYYVNTGTWTEIIYDLATMRRQEQRFPFLEVTYPDGDRPRWSLLVWYGRDEAALLWQEGSAAAGRLRGREARDQV
ncbi:MAG: UDP-2,3-diacylglucosamine diphosphatase [Oscillochloris sp.]|nr:UDP-2,3-diacylglucosamine diphosphatase [Oscillochloris sp.]